MCLKFIFKSAKDLAASSTEKNGRLNVLCLAAAIHIHGSEIRKPDRGRDCSQKVALGLRF